MESLLYKMRRLLLREEIYIQYYDGTEEICKDHDDQTNTILQIVRAGRFGAVREFGDRYLLGKHVIYRHLKNIRPIYSILPNEVVR